MTLQDPEYLARLERHYDMVKEKLAPAPAPPRRRGRRNAARNAGNTDAATNRSSACHPRRGRRACPCAAQ